MDAHDHFSTSFLPTTTGGARGHQGHPGDVLKKQEEEEQEEEGGLGIRRKEVGASRGGEDEEGRAAASTHRWMDGWMDGWMDPAAARGIVGGG